ncbi:low molecular weight protein-tyrosine-phosphatase [Corynebacterium halotolerans]|uniref:protein-tyrosine-phosphatase n=1 Tax=Corynebacterium halotolerans YIM 70093 = DSM 44683 TaxID=1121362 RepID=M1NZT2_9CORY|nr:low molecular weight protein-tyrosine-phosphatase [Corynebacterium halotolerans]AGF73000.1 low molecular weight protein-tyrosine- phosphatase [Corynebacterium halotolerans YIM 70093 = DSM 44683]
MTGTPASSETRPETDRLHLDFICTGNICRSPMAEIIVRDALENAGLGGHVRVSSSGIGGWHVGQGADRRAVAELRAAGYDGSEHTAAQLGPANLAADLLIALDTGHRSEVIARGADEDRVRLLRSFDPDAPDEASVADPYYGGPEGFTLTRHQIEAAVPGILAWVRERLDSRVAYSGTAYSGARR